MGLGVHNSSTIVRPARPPCNFSAQLSARMARRIFHVHQLGDIRQFGYTASMQEINNFLDTEIVRRSHNWKLLKRFLGQALPQEFLEQVNYATLNDGKLTIFSNSPAWSSRLRFHSTEIIAVFAEHGQKVTHVQARTVPPMEDPTQTSPSA